MTGIIDINYVHTVIKKRRSDIHKGDCGRVLVVAGSKGMAGAAVLCARGALRSGAGLVTAAISEELFTTLHTAQPEAMCMPRRLSAISETDMARFDAVAVGPGMGEAEENERIVRYLLKSCKGTLVIDADGLNTVAGKKLLPEVRASEADIIVTPHMGEAARLLETTTERICAREREETARLLAEVTGGIAVLKGAGTLVASGSRTYMNTTGNPGMATGGAGDVLTGLIAGLAAQGLAAEDAAKAGVFIHGMAGDIAAEKLSEYGMLAGDIAEAIPSAYREILK